MSSLPLADGLVLVVKRDCPTCQLVAPLLSELRQGPYLLQVVSQDDPEFPAGARPRFDDDLELSDELEIEIVPTLLRLDAGSVVERAIGWQRDAWRRLSGVSTLGAELPESRPGCGALNLEPRHAKARARRRAAQQATSRLVELGSEEDPFEACFSRGYTDGLPVVPPTPERVEQMLSGTSRDRAEVIATIAPDYADCTVEKVAINAVMAGCRPEYLPVVLSAVEAACTEAFNWHGVAATTYAVGPIVIVNGPVTTALGMASGINAMGQGHRANNTIGRALMLVLRNVGGARPGEVDRATLGHPGKLSFCFAEHEKECPWISLAETRGVPRGRSAVTLFAGEGPRTVIDQASREPQSLARSLASALRSVAHPKLALAFDALLVVSPEHLRVFAAAGWSRQRLHDELLDLLQLPLEELVRGANGCAEGMPETLTSIRLPKFRDGGLLVAHAGGGAGMFSAIIGGWAGGSRGSEPVTREIEF